MLYPIVGARYRPPAQAILAALPQGTRLLLQPEPLNPHDPNAVMVIVPEIPEAAHDHLTDELASYGMSLEEVLSSCPWHLGYVPREAQPRPAGAAVLSFNARGAPCAKV